MNKGAIINGQQISELLKSALANYLIGVDLEPIPKSALIKKFSKIDSIINDLILKTKTRNFDITNYMIFNPGEHQFFYMNLKIHFILIHESNPLKNMEFVIDVPKSFFENHVSGKEPCLKPVLCFCNKDKDMLLPTVNISSKRYRDNHNGKITKSLELSISNINLEEFKVKKMLIESFSKEFELINPQPSDYTTETILVNPVFVDNEINIGDHNFVVNRGDLVRSNVVNRIEYVTNDVMRQLLENNNTDPNKLYLVAEGEDTSDRLFEIQIKTLLPNTRVSISRNSIQSKSYKVNWGEGTENKKTSNTYKQAGTYTIKIYDRIDDFYIESSDLNTEVLSYSVPVGYRPPFEWNENIISFPFGDNERLKVKINSFPGNIFINGKQIYRVLGIVKSDTLTTVEETLFNGLTSVTLLEARGLFDNVTVVSEKLLSDLYSVRAIPGLFKGSKITSLPQKLFQNCESLQDITSLCENSKIISIPENFLANIYTLKVTDYAFKNISSLNGQNITTFLTSFFGEKYVLKSIKGMFQDTPISANISSNIVSLINRCSNLANMAFTFKNSKVQNGSVEFKLNSLENLETIESIFENVGTFNVNSPILQNCLNNDNNPINVTNCLKGTVKNTNLITQEDKLYVDTEVEGTSGLF